MGCIGGGMKQSAAGKARGIECNSRIEEPLCTRAGVCEEYRHLRAYIVRYREGDSKGE